ncbi:unnamed protein product [Ciceribacter sp. T2.26MG-112.2]|nr:unnamed protein product [Ciceribacter naphthalenivorans]
MISPEISSGHRSLQRKPGALHNGALFNELSDLAAVPA